MKVWDQELSFRYKFDGGTDSGKCLEIDVSE